MNKHIELPALARYTLSIVADSGYESTTEGTCTAEQYGNAIGALHGTPAAHEQARVVGEPVADHERWLAIREGNFNVASEEYFAARPHLDTPETRRVFYAGHCKGYDASHPEPQEAQAGMVLVPDWKGYALLGTGRYIINHSADFDPALGAELFITLATEEDRAGDRKIGETRDSRNPGQPVESEDMVLRIGFLNERGLFALEDQLRIIRETHFAAPVAPPATEQAEAPNPLADYHRDQYEHAFNGWEACKQECDRLRDELEEATQPTASNAGERRWPFAETPGEFASRLRTALYQFDMDILAAVRNVLIENPPALASKPAEPVAPPEREASVRVPKRLTQAMRDVMDTEGWCWEDLLAAAEAITEDEYAALSATTPAPAGQKS